MEGTRGEEGKPIEREPIEGPNSGEQNKHETYGPLDIERHRKDDSRALILYTTAKRGKE